jgi:hypothetical protein
VRLAIAVAALLLSASAQAAVPESAHTLATHLADAMKKCWFSGDKAFASYRYAPEVNIGTPRILLVSKKDPNGRPLLVVEPKRAGTADAYGPLLASALAERIKADLTRWLKGGSDCG